MLKIPNPKRNGNQLFVLILVLYITTPNLDTILAPPGHPNCVPTLFWSFLFSPLVIPTSKFQMGLMRCILPRRSKSKSSPTSSTGPSTPTLAAETPTKQLERVFNKFDSNGDGKISSSELAAIFQCLGHPTTDEELEIMMGEADFNGDGYISLEEFLELNTEKVDAKAALEDLRHAFSVFDMDRNGSISVDELEQVLRSIGEGASMAQCKKMIDGVDQDGDGLISFEEFKDMMMGP